MLQKLWGLFTKDEDEVNAESGSETAELRSSNGLVAIARIKKHFALVSMDEEEIQTPETKTFKKEFVDKTRCGSCDSEFYYMAIRCPICESYEMKQIKYLVKMPLASI